MNKNKYAYVNLMYGDNDYFLGTLVFIVSLINTKPKYDTLLLYTHDVPKYKLDILKKYYTKMKEITYIDAITSRTRFKEIFTKLKIFTLTEYEKIIYLDNDMFVNKNIDHVFDKYDAPAGVALSENLDFTDGEKVEKKNVVFNAGFWLIKPSMTDYKEMFYNLKNFNTTKELEQEYVSYFYNQKWTNISYLYNFQFSLSSLNSNKKRTIAYKNTKLDEVYVIHYSTSFKPWNIVSNTSIINTKDWVKIYAPYYKIWLDLFMQLYNTYRSEGINLLDLEEQLKNMNKYIKRVYPYSRVLKLTDFQRKKLDKKLNEKISGSDYTFMQFIEELKKHKCKIYLTGGAVRNLFNDDEINDIDASYDIKPDKFEKIIQENFKNLVFRKGKKYKNFFKIGEDYGNNIDLYYIKKLDTFKNIPANTLILDVEKNLVYDPFGSGIKNAEKKIFVKPPTLSYEHWLTSSGIILGRLIKFLMLGYKSYETDRKHIYNDFFFIKNDKGYFKKLSKYFITDKEIKLAVLEKDIDNLKLKYSGKQFINKLLNNLPESSA